MKCDRCDKEIGKSAYGKLGKLGNKVHCFDCCADIDRQSMIDTGNSKHLPLYLSVHGRYLKPLPVSQQAKVQYFKGVVTNWPASLSFNCDVKLTRGGHNIAGTRYDVWFNGPDGYIWHGVNYGENTMVCHCKRTKQKAV